MWGEGRRATHLRWPYRRRDSGDADAPTKRATGLACCDVPESWRRRRVSLQPRASCSCYLRYGSYSHFYSPLPRTSSRYVSG